MNIEKSCGAVLFTEMDGIRHYVLVSKRNEINCGMPKGHMENDESEEETALREISEEVCIKAEIMQGFRKQIEYILPNNVMKQVVYFIASYKKQTAKNNPSENLDVLLLPFNEALNAITFENTKNILEEAESWLVNFPQ